MENLRSHRTASNKNYMRIISGILTMLLVGLVVNGCDSGNITNGNNQATYEYFEQKLANDVLFGKVIKSSKEYVKFASDKSHGMDDNFDLGKFQEEINKRKYKGDIINVLAKFTTKPNQFYNLVQTKYSYQQKFIAQNPTFLDLSEKQQKRLIKNAIQKKHFSADKKKIRAYSIPRMKIDTEADEYGQCEEQLELDLRDCHREQYTAAAFCGLLSPTIFVALGCAASTITYAGLCHGSAEDNYYLCTQYE